MVYYGYGNVKKKEGKGISTLLNEAKGKQVRIYLQDGDILDGTLEKFSRYELEIVDGNKSIILWKQFVKYMEIQK